MTRRLHVAEGPGELRLAVTDADGILAAEVHRAAHPDRVGEVHLARLGAASSGASGWFLRLAAGEAFLPMGEIPPAARASLAEGEAVVVRIIRAAQAEKGLRASMKRAPAAPAGLSAPALLAPAPDPVARLAALHAAAPVRGPFFPPEIEEEFACLAEPEVALPGGGRLRLYPTPAATLIDVDSGPRMPAEANAVAAHAAARAIVARNLSGVILVDFAGLDGAKAKRGAAEALRAALAIDPLAAEVTGHSPAGLVEVVRRKQHPPLHEVLGEAQAPFRASALTLGLAALRAALAEALARPALRPALRAHPAVLQALAGDQAGLAAFAARAGAALVLRPDAGLSRALFHVEDARDG